MLTVVRGEYSDWATNILVDSRNSLIVSKFDLGLFKVARNTLN